MGCSLNPVGSVIFVVLLLVACMGAGVWNACADEVSLTNADRISGRVISLSPQTVRIATSHSGTMDEIEEKPTEAANAPKPIGQRPEDEADIRRIFLRQSSVLLKADEKEFEIGFNYLGNQVSATVYNAKFRQFQLPLSFRIGVFERVEGFVSIPFIYAQQEIAFAADSVTESTAGIGDTSLGINYEMFKESAQWPDIATALTIRAPTGDEPNETGLSTGSGHWAGSIGLQCIKTADPVVLFWGVRYTHEFEATHFLNDGVYGVQPGETVDYNFGFGFAVNDKVSLSNQVLGGYQWETKADGRKISGSASEPVSFRSALTYRILSKTYVEPSVTIGLNDERPDFVLGICATRRFGD